MFLSLLIKVCNTWSTFAIKVASSAVVYAGRCQDQTMTSVDDC